MATAGKSSIVARLTRGGAAYGVATLVTRGIAFLLLPLYTRYLSPADYGQVSLSETVAVVIPMFGGLGLNAAFQRMYFDEATEEERASTVATVLRGALLWQGIFLAVALLLGATVIRWVAPHFGVSFWPFVAIAFVTACANQIVELRQILFQNEERARAYAGVAIGSFVLTAACAVTLVVGVKLGGLGILIGKLTGAVVFATLAVVLLWKHLRAPWKGTRMREALRIGIPLIPHMAVALVLGSADVLFIQTYNSVAEVGLYSVAYALGASATVVTSVLMLTWSPIFYDLARNEERDREPVAQTSVLLATVMLGACTVGTALAWFVIPLILHERYAGCADLVPIVMAGYVFHMFFGLFHLALLQVSRSYLIALVTVSAALVNIALNFVLIPRWGAMGAAVATMVAYATEAVAMYVAAQRFFRIPYPLRTIGAATTAYLAVVAASQLPPGVHGRRLILVAVALATSALLFLIGRRAKRRAELR